MGYFDGFGGLVFIAVWIFCFIDVLVTPDGQCRNLPKLAWLFIVLLVPLVGSIAWLVAGHNWTKSATTARTGTALRFPTASRQPSRVATNPDDDEEFLAGLRKRAEEQRRARDQHETDGPDTDPA